MISDTPRTDALLVDDVFKEDRKLSIQLLTEHARTLERENAAQLAELHRISEALGTNDGHSSVTHIEILKEENAALRKALLRVVEVYDAMGGVCGSARIAAEEALAKEEKK